jgi:signal transduction histidine kinase/CHASE3 domain sensor protein
MPEGVRRFARKSHSGPAHLPSVEVLSVEERPSAKAGEKRDARQLQCQHHTWIDAAHDHATPALRQAHQLHGSHDDSRGMDDAHPGSMETGDHADRTSDTAGAVIDDCPPYERRSISRNGASWIPSGFVIFALLILLAVPLWRERRISTLATETLQPAQDARGMINDVTQAFSEAESSLRGYLLTGNERLLHTMEVSHAAESRGIEELREHAALLGPPVVEMVERLSARSRDAQQRRLNAAAAAAPDPDIALDAHESMLLETAQVRAAIIDRGQQARARIEQLERAGALIMLILGSLALVATILVVVIARRDRRIAAFEADLRYAALTLAEATDVEDILARIVTSVARTVTGASSFVERIDEHTGAVEVVTTAGTHVLPAGTRLPFPGSLTEAALRSGAPEQFHVASMSERPSATALAAICNDCAGVVVPLISDDSHGALLLLRPGRAGFGPREMAQLRIFGVFATLALRKGVLLARAVEQRRDAQRAARARARMVRGFSHDLKNPLGAADGHAALLEEGVLGDLTHQQREHVQRIRTSLQESLGIIEDVVELARAESGQLRLQRASIQPATLIRELAREYEAVAASAGIAFDTRVPDGLPAIETDPRRVRQVVGNLITNAVKYTPSGGSVKLIAELRQGRRSIDPSCWLTLAVVDTGPGIAADDLQRIFGEFQRLNADATSGAGLGLAISQKIAELLHGEITVKSEVGKGSTFALWLPYACDQDRHAA